MAEINFLSVLTLFLGVTAWFYYRKPVSSIQDNLSVNSTYDYIIVGAGSAGSVIASRLSEDPNTTVLLLEAGPSDEPYHFIHIPLMPMELQRSDLDWSYETTSQRESMKALKNNINYWPRGRVLGGSSSLNYMAYVRGSHHDYNQWAAEGCDRWSYKDVLPYFIKSEDNLVPWLQESSYHGKGGPLKVSPGQATSLNTYYSKAMQELGYDIIDCNGESQIGYEPITLTTMNGARCNTARSFLQIAAQRQNLHISVSSKVSKLLIKDKAAYGVEFIRGNRKHRVNARREVILSAGSINTPQILMLSGIGPKKHLESLEVYKASSYFNIKFEILRKFTLLGTGSCKIPVVADLPVGQNLQDHLFVPFNFFPNVSLTITPEKASTLWNNLVYKITGKGYFITSGLEGNAFFNTKDKSSNAYADIQIMFFSAHFPGMEEDVMISKLNYKKETVDVILKPTKTNRNAFTLLPTLLHPKSTGTITLQSTDPFDPPKIEPQYLTDKADIDTLIRGVKRTLELGSTDTFRKLGINMEDTYLPFPGCTKHQIPSDAYLECYIRNYAQTVYHPTTTCRMGKMDDPTTVVGSDLRVKGISNLRVADASVMRNVVSGNTNAPTIMIGEKAADLIRGVDTVKNIKLKLQNIK